MSILTIDQARSQCRVDPDYPTEQLQPYIDGAESAAADYLNRYVYPDQAALDAALDGVADAVGSASATYESAISAALTIADAMQRQAAMDVAQVRLNSARTAAARTVHGVVASPAIVAAILLTLGHLFANREDAVVGAVAVELPNGARELLRPYRRVMMP